jgi:biotin carboxylase
MSSPVLLLMRSRLRPNAADHVQALLDLGLDVHLVTSVADNRPDDPRFVSSAAVPAGLAHDQVVRLVTRMARDREAAAVITFSEYDIVVAGEVNEALGLSWARPEADRICRDKSRQRAFLRDHEIPSPRSYPVSGIAAALDAAAASGFPLIVKPTRAASSTGVELVDGPAALRTALARLGADRDGPGEAWALQEEYIPGREVTLDGIVLDGRFVLGAVHDKARMDGPFFEEDLYTLPFSTPEREAELTAIAESVTKALNLDRALFNAELREDGNGEFRVIEFSTRISGGHVYRNIKDVYGIDLVRLFVRSILSQAPGAVTVREAARRAPRTTTCIKRLYADGQIRRNSVGAAIHEPAFRAYYPMSVPGQVVASAPRGFDAVGAVSVWLPWRPGQAPAVVHSVARAIAARLDVEVEGTIRR